MWRHVIALVLCSSLATACVAGDNTGVDSGVDSGTPAGSVGSQSFVSSDCINADYPEPLGVATVDPQEIDYLDDVVACTDAAHTTTWLLNNSDAVWEISLGGEKKAIQGQPTAFRSMFGDTAFAPGDAITFPSYEPYEWHVDPRLSATWVGYDLEQDEFQSIGATTATKALDKQTPVGAAVLTCSLAFGDAAGVDTSADADEVLANVFEVGAGGAQCRESLGRLTYTDATGQQVTYLDDITRLKAETATVERISSRLHYSRTAATFAKFVLQLR